MTDLQPDLLERPLAEVDPEVAGAIEGELGRQRNTLEMIASENFVPEAVLECQGSVLTNKYAEGYPGRRYPLACGPDPGTLGLRVPDVPALAAVGRPVLQSSANLAGGADPRRLEEIPESIRDGADLVLEGGALPGIASTVIDLRRFEDRGEWTVVRHGAVPAASVEAAVAGTLRP